MACRSAATVAGGWGMSGCPAADVVMAAPMGVILIAVAQRIGHECVSTARTSEGEAIQLPSQTTLRGPPRSPVWRCRPAGAAVGATRIDAGQRVVVSGAVALAVGDVTASRHLGRST